MAMDITCRYCGQTHPADAAFCPTTGHRLSKPNPAAPVSIVHIVLFVLIGAIGLGTLSAGLWLGCQDAGICRNLVATQLAAATPQKPPRRTASATAEPSPTETPSPEPSPTSTYTPEPSPTAT